MLLKLKQNTPAWLKWRERRATGTKLEKMIPSSGILPKIGFFEYAAESLAIETDDEDPRARGRRLEPEARELLGKEVGINFTDDFVIESDDIDRLALSPDGLYIGKKYIIGCEIKCLAPKNHLEALYINMQFNKGIKCFPRSNYLKNIGIPAEYIRQAVGYFIVEPKLETLYFTFYCPDLTVKQLFYIKINRSDIKDIIEEQTIETKNILQTAYDFISELSF